MGKVTGGDGTAAIIASDVEIPLEDASFLQAVLESIPAFVLRVDPEQRISYINHLRSGVTLQEVIGRPVREFIAPEHFERYQKAVAQALRTDKRCSYVVRGSRNVLRGGAAYYEGHVVPIDIGDGQRAMCIIASDVSEHVDRAVQLEQSQQKLRIAVEATGVGLWTWDAVTDAIDLDQRTIEILGQTPTSHSDYIARIVHEDDRPRILRERELARAGRPAFPEHRIVRPDGEIRWLLPCGRVIEDEAGNVLRLIGGILDVTTQRLLDDHVRKAQKLDAVGSLTAGVAHNFNNMLAVILPALERSLRDCEPEQNPMLEDALHAAQRAGELVEQLMTFAGQRRVPLIEPYELGPVILRAVSMCERTFDRRVRIDAAIDPNAQKVACDPAAIEQVVVNLLINARDALTESEQVQPRIAIALSEAEIAPPAAPLGGRKRYVRIRVEDNGIGMSDSVKQHLFEPFFTTKAPGKGSGLGLATSYGIVRDHGGFIVLESQRELGTIASVYLPPASAPSASVASTLRQVRDARKGAILVIDDEPAVRRAVSFVLGERGHRVHEADSGRAAVAVLDQGFVPDLILLDCSMPGWPMKLTIEEIRKRLGEVPIVFFTGQDVPSEDRAQVRDVLYKPLSTDELLRSVELLIAPGA